MKQIISDLSQSKLKTLMDQYYKNIEMLTKEALKINNIDFDFEKYKNSRFKYFDAVTDLKDNSFTVYFNDGSVDGLKLFSIPDINLSFTLNKTENFKDKF